MTERIGISLILLVIAVAHLATDVVRLALEVAPRPSFNDAGPVPTRSVEQEMPRPPPSREQPEQLAGPTASWAFDPPRANANQADASQPNVQPIAIGFQHQSAALVPGMPASRSAPASEAAPG